MSGTFPSSPAPRAVRVRSLTPTLVSVAHSLKRQVRSRGTQRWGLALSFPPMTRAQFAPIWAFLVAQRGQYETFTYTLPGHAAQGTWAGTPLVNGASQTGRSVLCDGFTAGATVKAGDFFKFGGHSKIYMVSADGTADGSGNLTLSIEPALMQSPADNEALTSSSLPWTVALASDNAEYDVSPGLIFGNLEVELVEVY
ncbi:MAG TPA: hypothetical protein VFP70_12655 [Burkholderiales bacterium]|nr:hypothetical protein [Burkholderiales bacterium]